MFDGFAGTTGLSDFPCSCISGVRPRPSLSGPPGDQPGRRARDLPVLAQGDSTHAQVLRPRRAPRQLAIALPAMWPSAKENGVGTPNRGDISRLNSPACVYRYRRFACILTDADARLAATVDRYSFGVGLFHSLLPAGLSRRTLLRSSPITGPSSLLRAVPPLCLASVLCRSRCSPLAVLPLAHPSEGDPADQVERYQGDRFSCSMPAPTTSSRHLYTGHRQGNTQAAPWLRAHPDGRAFVPGTLRLPGFDAIV